jgi:hypothetical protein
VNARTDYGARVTTQADELGNEGVEMMQSGARDLHGPFPDQKTKWGLTLELSGRC